MQAARSSPEPSAAAPTLAVATALRRVFLACWPVLAATGCVVPAPEVDTPDAALPILQILRGKLAPSPVDEVELEIQNTASRQDFSATGAIDARGTRSPLYYHWYYDWETGDPLLPVCFQSQQNCSLYPCQALDSSKDNHTMLLVVADQPIAPDAEHPYKFPDTVAWDAVLWQVRYQGSCPP